jgi:primosomal protein N' (replication factor Y)
VILKEVEEPSFTCESIQSKKEKSFSSLTLELAKFIAEYYVCSLGEALALFTPLHVKVFEPKELLHVKINLSTLQQKALDFIDSHEKSLLFGKTGSGKTEIYIKAIEKVLNENKSAILLLPEIGLSPQMKKRLKSYFGEAVAIWHSKITKKAKENIIKEIEEGKVRLIAGTRSALFLPLHDIGLIVVDEEHDDSYKSNSRPRYNAKDLAHLFAKKYNAKLILGSATPSLGSFKNSPFFKLDETFHKTQKTITYENNHNELTESLISKINTYIKQKKQVVIFLPTRANFKYISCQSCGSNVLCPFCSVGMSLHSEKNALKCHYCNYMQRIPQVCPECGCEDIEAKRIGTSEVVLRLKEVFKESIIEKFDRDEITTENKLKNKLQRFNASEIDILVGTQMLAKGHDYHNVGLSVVMGIDTLLNMPDFRAREKAIALAIQIAGRAGRSGEGEVYIQTRNQEIFERYMRDYELFMQEELAFRQELYPPFKKLLKVLVSHKNDTKASEILSHVEKLTHNFKSIEVVGYGKADVEKIAGKYRYNMLLRSSETKALLQFAHMAKKLQVEIDIDPLSFS